jgi:hypothetical protein
MNDELTLYNIEAGLAELMASREEAELELVMARAAVPCASERIVEAERQLEFLDKSILAYVEAGVQKVDGTRGWLRMMESRINDARDEAKRQDQAADAMEASVARLKEFLIYVMQGAGKTRLEGKTGKIRIQDNGGVLPVVIDSESMLPDFALRYAGWISAEMYSQLFNMYGPKALEAETHLKSEPDKTVIRKVLEENCEECEGTGIVLDDDDDGNDIEGTVHRCPSCGGKGKRGVPGARFGQQGVHIRWR